MPTATRFSPEVRERAVRLVQKHVGAAMGSVTLGEGDGSLMCGLQGAPARRFRRWGG